MPTRARGILRGGLATYRRRGSSQNGSAEVVNPPEANRSRQGLAPPGQPLEDDLDWRAALLRVAPRNAFAHLANLGRE